MRVTYKINLKTDETSKNDLSKLASQITRNCGHDPKEKLRSHFDEARGIISNSVQNVSGIQCFIFPWQHIL